MLNTARVFRVDIITVQPFAGSNIRDVIKGMFELELQTGALVTCVFNNVELKTNFSYSQEGLRDYYLTKLKEGV